MFLLAPLACQDAKPPGGASPGPGPAPAAQAELPDPNVRFGMPAPAAADPDNREAYLITRKQYALSYNDKTHNPNWVAWRLTQDDIGKAKRGAFQPDPLLPRGFGKVTAHTYEVRCSEDMAQCYHLYRVFDFARPPKVYVLSGSLQRLCLLEPIQYRATL
jgi:hypothetical protein